MKNLLILIVLFISAYGISQETNSEDYIIDEKSTQEINTDSNSINGIEENIPSKKENLKEEKKNQRVEGKKLKRMAEKRAVELQKALNLTNYTTYKLLNSILKYSKKANKVIQSNISEDEKSRTLTNIVHFQNQEFKEYLTVHQFYKYLEISSL